MNQRLADAIQTEGLVKKFGPLVAVNGIDLAVPRGAVYGFLGPNGSGKTTTIRMILGLLRPNAGEARIFGRNVQTDRIAALDRVGALVEAPALYDHLSGRDNLEITRRILGLPRAEIDRVLEISGIGHAQRRRAGGYSQGMRQRLGLARALLGSPELLLLDEPTNGLDPDGIQDMRALIRSLPEQTGATVLLSSHLLSEVEQTASHVGLMFKGHLVLQGTLEEALGSTGASGVAFGVDAPERGVQVLGEAWPDKRATVEDGALYVTLDETGDGRAETAAITAALVGAGLQVFRVTPRSVRLEDVYVAHTAAKGRADARAATGDRA